MTSVMAIFDAAGLTPRTPIPWGSPVSVRLPGVYAIATTDDAELEVGLADCPIDDAAVRELMRAQPEALVDGAAANTRTLTDRLRSMWVTGEPVVYIGLAGISVATRVGQFYKTPIGARAPHAGGWPVKMLEVGRLWVHTAPCADPDAAERAMVEAFGQRLSPESIARLIDPTCRVPFANLMYPGGRRKQHGLTGVKAARVRAEPPDLRADIDAPPEIALDATTRPTVPLFRTQRVTSADIRAGRLRVPSRSKGEFPRNRDYIAVDLRGEHLTCRWDPKYGPDRERSGTIAVPKATLERLVSPGSQLTLARDHDRIRLS